MAHPRMYDDADPLLGRVRACCAALPQALEFESHGRPNFRAGPRRVFAVHGAGPSDEEGLKADARFFVPPCYPDRLALDLDAPDRDWTEVAELIDTAYRMVASGRMLRQLDAGR